ncbi:MAG: FAD:protein FMN transferase [Firmicutes bacterium]|nr:FAD:protein FMN transferase [Bacillota bacterium]
MNNLGRAVKSTALIVLLAFMIITHTACGDEGPPSKTDFCLDTSCTITIYDDMDKSDAEQLLEDSFALIREKEDLLSRTVEGSEVDQINGADGQWTEVSAETIDIIRTANMISYESGGVFDITIGKITQLWDFKAEEPEVPADEDIQAALPYIDYKTITTGGGKVKLSDPEAEIDLGGVAKGAIADMVCAFLEANGVTSAVVNLGGNVVVIGEKAEDTPWTVGIERPFTDRKELVGVVQVTDKAVVTSGIYERNFEAGDKIYHHILDPETGYPAETDLEAVTIIANKGYSGFCDAVSTACLILGKDKAPQFIEQLQAKYPDRGIEAAFIDNGGNIVQTDGMQIMPAE